MQIITSVIATMIVVILFLSIVGFASRKQREKKKKEFAQKALDYIAENTYEQMLNDLKGKNISLVAMQSYIVVKDWAKHIKNQNERAVYKKIQQWRRKGKI